MQNRSEPTIPETMRAAIRRKYGSSEVLRVETMPVPNINDEEVLVRVHAAGLDRGAEHMMTGTPYIMRLATGLRRPKRPNIGRDIAGTVVRVGANVSKCRIDDEVFGIAPSGAFSEYAVAPETRLATKPSSVGFEQAAVVPVSGLTALQTLVDVGRLQPDHTVLIIGASGGVGSFAVQIATAFGAEVTGVCSTSKVDLVESLGAHHVVDYTTQDFASQNRSYDLILDIGGNSPTRRLRQVINTCGTIVLVGGETGATLTGLSRQLNAVALSPLHKHHTRMMLAKEQSSGLEKLAKLIDDGKVIPALDQTFPLDNAADAMQALSDGQVRGKIALTT